MLSIYVQIILVMLCYGNCFRVTRTVTNRIGTKLANSYGNRYSNSNGNSNTMSMSFYNNPNNVNLCADVHLVPMFADNYGFILIDRVTKQGAWIDPGDGIAMVTAANKLNIAQKVNMKYVLCTHKHDDHIGGNSLIKSYLPDVEIIGTKYEPVPELQRPVGDGDKFSIGSLTVTVIHTPCHTKGHVVYFVEGNEGKPILFAGDTLFVGGCGRFFEGTAKDMLINMNKLAQLPPCTTVFCAHEYTVGNLKFLSSVDPICEKEYNDVKSMRKKGIATVPTTIEKELSYNLFMKCNEKQTQALVGATSPEEAMATLRSRKNNF